MPSQSNCSSVIGPSKILTGLVIGSLHVASNLVKRKLTQSCLWTIHAPQPIFAISSAVSILLGHVAQPCPCHQTPSYIAQG
ncbi:hypothetical protein ACHAW6_006158 [Cyclotella cf. meneghiniana]